MNVDWTDPSRAVLSLLLCGHMLADFVFQPSWMVQRKKNSAGVLTLHTLEVVLVQGLLILPFLGNQECAYVLTTIGLSHFCIDGLKIFIDKRLPDFSLWTWFGDQLAHVAVLAVIWHAWATAPTMENSVWIGPIAAFVAALAFNGNGGSAIVSKTLETMKLPESIDDGPKGAGRKIGILERWMILGLVWAGQWGAVGLVLTAKSIARFKKMDEQSFAETYLVGTMTSVIVAMASGVLLRQLI